MKKNTLIILIGFLAVHLLLLITLKFTAWPEMTLWPYLMTKGWLPYTNIAIAHTPHLLISLSWVYRIFGVGILQLKIYTWVLILLTDLLVYYVAQKGWGKKIAFLSLGFFIFWQLFFEGNGLWFDLMLTPLSLMVFYFLTKKKYFWTGIFWAFMLFNKQTAFWFLLPIAFSLGKDIIEKHLTKTSIKILWKFTLGALTTLVIWIGGLWVWGVIPDFYNWAINFGIFILPKASGQVQMPSIKNLIATGFPFLVFIPLIFSKEKYRWNLTLWAVAGSLGTLPRFEYFHFQPATAYLAIAAGIFFSKMNWKNIRVKVFVIIYGLTCLYLFGGFFMRNFKEGTRFYEKNVTDVISYIKYNTKAGDKIFVLNFWDNIYALSDTLPATDPWVPQLSWYMEISGVQEKMIENMKADPPKLIVYSPYTELGLSAYIPKKVYEFVTENYTLSGRVDNLEILTQK